MLGSPRLNAPRKDNFRWGLWLDIKFLSFVMQSQAAIGLCSFFFHGWCQIVNAPWTHSKSTEHHHKCHTWRNVESEWKCVYRWNEVSCKLSSHLYYRVHYHLTYKFIYLIPSRLLELNCWVCVLGGEPIVNEQCVLSWLHLFIPIH